MTESTSTELAQAMRDRVTIYTLLSRLLGKEVDEELLAALKAEPILVTDEPGLQAGLEKVEQYLASDEASVLDLARDYAKTFCGAGATNKDSAYPFESFYTSRERLLMQEARDEVLAWYHRYGLGKAENWHDCEDHVALEMEFVVFLTNAWLEAEAAGDAEKCAELLAAQRDFVRDHLVNWLPLFSHDVKKRARTEFYKGVASLASAYVKQDLAALEGACAR